MTAPLEKSPTLAAADAEDLQVLSARLQDATAKLGDLVWLPSQRRFAALFNRFRWEEKGGSRVRAAITFGGVLKVQAQNLKKNAPDAMVSLLAIRFAAAGEGEPGGSIELIFSGGGTMRLDVECIDAELSDITGPWTVRARPRHGDES